MTATGRSLSLCLALAVLAGCDQDTPRRNLVVGPTPILTPPPPPPIDVRDIDRRFDDRFWRQLVFNQYDDPGSIDQRIAWLLDDHKPERLHPDG